MCRIVPPRITRQMGTAVLYSRPPMAVKLIRGGEALMKSFGLVELHALVKQPGPVRHTHVRP